MEKAKKRWTDGKGWKGWAMAVPQLWEICYSRNSAMAQLLEQSWRSWKEELTCGVMAWPSWPHPLLLFITD